MASRNAKGRMVYWKISYSKQLARCSIVAKLLFTWLIPNTDDLGRMEGEPEIIKGMIFPYDDKISVKQIRESLQELTNEQLIIWYSVGENLYIQFPKFGIYQTLRKDRDYTSDYPDPPDLSGHDMTSQDMTGHVGQNLREVKGSEVKEKGSEVKENKTHFTDHVALTETEYSKLVAQYGEKDARRLVEILENYKASKGKTYKSDYHAILNWVVKRLSEEKSSTHQRDRPRQGNQVPKSDKYKDFYL